MLKQALVSVESPGPFRELASKHNSNIKVAECMNLDSRGMVLLLEVDGGHQKGLVEDLQGILGVRHVYCTRGGPAKALAMVTMDMPLLCEIANGLGVLCMSCPFSSAGAKKCEWRVLVRDVPSLWKFVDELEERGIQAPMTKVSNVARMDILTQRQREIVLEAMRLGYFDFPRKTTLAGLAKRLSVKPSTLSEAIRKVEGKMVNHYLESGLAA